jgi:HEXXH motif-containing protein
MLVHEAAHQYFYLATRLEPLLVGGEQTHYSPLKRAARPLSKLFLGFHAFANVMVLHDRLRRAGADDGYVAEAWPSLERETDQLRETLAANATFTPFGNAMFELLAERTVSLRE